MNRSGNQWAGLSGRSLAAFLGLGAAVLAVAVWSMFVREPAQEAQVEARSEKAAAERDEIRDLLGIVVAFTGCEITDTPQRCREIQAERSRLEGEARLLVVDCIVRQALAGAPPLAAGERCVP